MLNSKCYLFFWIRIVSLHSFCFILQGFHRLFYSLVSRCMTCFSLHYFGSVLQMQFKVNNYLSFGIVMMKREHPRKTFLIQMVNTIPEAPVYFSDFRFCALGWKIYVWKASFDTSWTADDIEAVKRLAGSKLSKTSGVYERIDLLQRAEEKYYQNKNSKQVHSPPFLSIPAITFFNLWY